MRGLPDAPAPGPAVVDYDIAWAFAEPIPDQHDTLQDLFAEAGSRKIVLLHENGFWGYWPVLLGAAGRRADVVIAVGVTPITISSIDTAPFGLGLPPDATAEGRARNRALNEQVRESLVATPAMPDTVFGGFGVVAPSSVFDAAIDLRTARPTGRALREAIDRALDGPELRTAANGLAAEMRRLDPFQSIVNEVESLLVKGSA